MLVLLDVDVDVDLVGGCRRSSCGGRNSCCLWWFRIESKSLQPKWMQMRDKKLRLPHLVRSNAAVEDQTSSNNR